MLIKFSVGNHLSFKELATIDLTAEGLKEKKDFLHVPYLYNPNLILLKSAVLYGYNSFGKSNLITAYSNYIRLIQSSFSFGSKSSELGIEPFRLNTSSAEKPSFFESVFIIRETKYRYGFEVDNTKVVSEWLFYSDGTTRENTLFVRHGQEFREISKLWNKNSGNKIEHARIFTKSNHLFLTVLLSQDDIPRVEDISVWFKGNIILNNDYSNSTNNGAAKIYSKEEYRSIILKFLENSDLGFTNVFQKISKISDKGFPRELANQLLDIEKENFELYSHHQVFDDERQFKKTIEFPLDKNESSGSIKYFIVACYLSKALKNGQLVWIDELDASLSSQLFMFLVNIFNDKKNNTTGSQLIFTTHNTILLDKKLRRDQIWIVDKNPFGESTLHKRHTAKTPIRIDKSIEEEIRQSTAEKGVSKKAINSNLPSLFDKCE